LIETLAKKIRPLISKLEDPKYTSGVYLASGPGTVRAIIEGYPEINRLVEEGSASAELLVEKFKEAPSRTNDITLCCFAVVIEKVKYLPAVSILTEFLKKYDEGIVDEHELKTPLWSPHFVNHTLKILTDQVDANKRYYTYYKRQREETVRRSQAWLKKREGRA
jgi:hypothetical protein